ncbi:MAG: ATP-binding cassette domain-containing protein [Kiritimatiellae bacterium]|nr:ATP-binding cassette domain-containing protein [Kiritimatiellia bacterium]
MSLVEFENVTKEFDGEKVLDGLSFKVEKGEIFCIVGQSGAGKSVTLKHLVRLFVPTSGRVLVDGVDVARASERELWRTRGRIGYLFQSAALLAWMTVADNVALPLRENTALDDAEIEKRTASALAEVELSHAAGKYPPEISGGMQKRAGLARAIVRESDIVLYDEPTSGLDPVTSVTIHRLIRKLNRTRGITSIVVTHDLAGAIAIADRILLIKDGKAAVCLPPAQFLESENPAAKEIVAAMKGDIG